MAPGVEDVAVQALTQANDVIVATGLTAHVFESAASGGGTATIVFADCPGTNSTPSTTHTTCAMNLLGESRDDHMADVVLMVVNDMTGCGGAPPAMVNAFTISHANEHLAHAVVKASCITNPVRGKKVAAHELGHLLSLEHHDGDPSPNVPVSYNHAGEDSLLGFGKLTADGDEGDGFLCDYHGFFSENGRGRLFPPRSAQSSAMAIQTSTTRSGGKIERTKP